MGELFARAGVLFGGLGVLLLILLGGGNSTAHESRRVIPIAYAMVENPETVQCLEGPCRTGIVLMNPQTGTMETFRVGAVYPETLHYSPDYSMISYNINTRLYVLDLQTHRTRLITNEYNDALLSRYGVNGWSPDSSQIAYTTPSGIEVLNLVTNERHIVSHLTSRRGFLWSPDGNSLLIVAYSADTRGEPSLYRIDLRTGEQINLTPDVPHVFFGTWSLDSNHIIFVAGYGRTFSIFSVNADGSNLQRIAVSRSDGIYRPLWILENTQLVYATRFLEWINIETNAVISIPDPFAPSVQKILGTDFSPDGTQYVVLHRDDKVYQDVILSIYDLETLERRDFMIKTYIFAYPEWGS